MKIKRFIAPDMRTALRRVREEHGENAVILSNRQVADGIEVVAAAGYGEASMQDGPAPAPAAATTVQDATLSDSILQALAAADTARAQAGAAAVNAPRPASQPTTAERTHTAPVRSPGAAARLVGRLASAPAGFGRWLKKAPRPSTPMAREVEAPPLAAVAPASHAGTRPLQVVSSQPAPDPGIAVMRDEIGAMRRMIERELGQLSSERLRGVPARAAALDLLEDFGMAPRQAHDLAVAIDPALPPDEVLGPLREQLAASIPVHGGDLIEEGGVIALVGPTGAGKTTTAAKLAARYAQRHGTRNVALVSIDRHRAAAREQLQAHGRRLGITVCEADGDEDLVEVLGQLADYPLVIIDTAGMSTRDKRLNSQLAWLRAIDGVESLLVMPANGNPHDLSALVERYAMVTPKGVVLTKVDETDRLGAALSVVIGHGLGVAYTGNGQAVPGDIGEGHGASLAVRLVEPAPADATVEADRCHAVA